MLGTNLKKIGVLAVLIAGSVTLMGSFSVAGDSVKIACTQQAVHNADACETLLRTTLSNGTVPDEDGPSTSFFSLGWMSLVRGAVKPRASCSQCQAQVAALYSSLENNQTISEIEKAGHVLCGQLYVNNVTQCDALVDQFVPQLIEGFVQNFPPSVACANLGVCAP